MLFLIFISWGHQEEQIECDMPNAPFSHLLLCSYTSRRGRSSNNLQNQNPQTFQAATENVSTWKPFSIALKDCYIPFYNMPQSPQE